MKRHIIQSILLSRSIFTLSVIISCLSTAGQSLTPQDVSFKWINGFEPQLSWKPPSHLPGDCRFNVTIQASQYAVCMPFIVLYIFTVTATWVQFVVVRGLVWSRSAGFMCKLICNYQCFAFLKKINRKKMFLFMKRYVCVCNMFMHIRTPPQKLFREEIVTLTSGTLWPRETAPGFGWRCLHLLKYMQTWAQRLCVTGAVLNEAYLHRRGFHFAPNYPFKYIQISPVQPCRHLHLSVFSAAFHLYSFAADRTHYISCYLHGFADRAVALCIWP